MTDFILSPRRKIVWDPEPVQPSNFVAEIKSQTKRKIQKPPKEAHTPSIDTLASNGHKALKQRDLTDSDRLLIKEEFLRRAGCLDSKDKICTSLRDTLNERFSSNKPLAVFQVTGYVSVLHRYIAMKSLELTPSQKVKYFKWMESQYGLWSQYNSEKYRKYRERKPPVTVSQSQPRQRYVHGVF